MFRAIQSGQNVFYEVLIYYQVSAVAYSPEFDVVWPMDMIFIRAYMPEGDFLKVKWWEELGC